MKILIVLLALSLTACIEDPITVSYPDVKKNDDPKVDSKPTDVTKPWNEFVEYIRNNKALATNSRGLHFTENLMKLDQLTVVQTGGIKKDGTQIENQNRIESADLQGPILEPNELGDTVYNVNCADQNSVSVEEFLNSAEEIELDSGLRVFQIQAHTISFCRNIKFDINEAIRIKAGFMNFDSAAIFSLTYKTIAFHANKAIFNGKNQLVINDKLAPMAEVVFSIASVLFNELEWLDNSSLEIIAIGKDYKDLPKSSKSRN